MQVACDIYLLCELTLEIIKSQSLMLYTQITSKMPIVLQHKGAFNTVLPTQS